MLLKVGALARCWMMLRFRNSLCSPANQINIGSSNKAGQDVFNIDRVSHNRRSPIASFANHSVH